MEKKRKQHYVFQAYLDAWTENGKLWCMYDKKTFQTGTMNVAQERDFYRIKPLNEDEKRFYDIFLSTLHPDVKKQLEAHRDTYLEVIEMKKNIDIINNILTLKFGNYDKIPNEIKELCFKMENSIDIAINNIEEDYHSDIESKGIKWIRSLCEMDNSFYFYDNKIINEGYSDEPFNFIFFVCTQYFRTKAMTKRWISSFETSLKDLQCSKYGISIEKIQLENLVHHFFWEMKNRLSYYLRRNKAHLTILINETDIPFITSDQPVINLYANYEKLSEEIKEIMLYYPISPKVAILLNDKNTEERIKLDVDKVDYYNNMIANAQYQYIFANNADTIKRYNKFK